MKKIALNLLLGAVVLMPVFLRAQSPIDKVYEKYSNKDGFTSVNISKELFQMFVQAGKDNAKDTSWMEMKKILNQLTGLKILTFSFDSSKIVKAVSIYNEFAGLFPSSTYKELMTLNEGRRNIKFLTKQDASGKINELAMLMKDKNEILVLSLTGVIDLSTIAQLSKGLNIKNIDTLKKINEHKGNK